MKMMKGKSELVFSGSFSLCNQVERNCSRTIGQYSEGYDKQVIFLSDSFQILGAALKVFPKEIN